MAGSHPSPSGLAGPLELQGVMGLQGTLGAAHEPEATSQSLAALAAAAPDAAAVAAVEAAAAKGKRDADDLDNFDAPEAKRVRLAAPVAAGSAHPGQEGALTAAAAAAAAAAVSDRGIPGHEAGDAAAAAVAGQLLQQAQLPILDPAAAAAMGLTSEQQAQMQQLMLQQMPLALSPEALAAVPTLPLLGGGGEVPPVALDPAAIAAFPILGPDGVQLTPEQVALVFGSNLPWVLPPGTVLAGLPVAGPTGGEGGYKNWWEEQEEKELVQLAEDASYRLEKLGIEELDWAEIAAYFGPARSQNAVRKKYWQLTRKGASADSDSDNQELTAVDPGKQRPRADRRMWTDEEALELVKLYGDSLYRSQVLHLGDNATEAEVWEMLASHFGCSVQTVKRKYRHAQEALNNGTLGADKGKRQHHRKRTPYRWMIVQALGELPNLQGTAPEIFERIEAESRFVLDLDQRIMPGTKHVPRWKIQVRKVLSGDKVFDHTGMKQKHETVWRLNQLELQEALASSHSANRNTAASQAAAEVMERLPHLRFDASAADPPADGQQLDPDMALMHQQIAATIAHAPLVVPPDQLPQMTDLQLAAAAGAPDMAAMHMAAPQQHGQLGLQLEQHRQQRQQSSELPASTAVAADTVDELTQHAHTDRIAEEQQSRQVAQGPPGLALPAGLHHLHPMQAAMQAAVEQQQQQQQQELQHAGSEGGGPGDGINAVHAAHAEQLAHLALPLSPLDPAALAALTAVHSPALPAAALPEVDAAAGLTLPLVHAPAALSSEQRS